MDLFSHSLFFLLGKPKTWALLPPLSYLAVRTNSHSFFFSFSSGTWLLRIRFDSGVPGDTQKPLSWKRKIWSLWKQCGQWIESFKKEHEEISIKESHTGCSVKNREKRGRCAGGRPGRRTPTLAQVRGGNGWNAESQGEIRTTSHWWAWRCLGGWVLGLPL